MNNQFQSDILANLLKSVEEVPKISSTDTPGIVIDPDDEMLELGEDFDFDGFQVVRREFFAHLREPSVTFNNCKLYVNSAALSKFPEYDYAQVIVNSEKKILALQPCYEEARDSFQWCSSKNGKRKPKAITCKLFFAKIVALMGWNPDYRYKMLGKVVHANGMYLLAFDLTSAETYRRTAGDDQKPRYSRKAIFPVEWQDQFGLPYNEHKQSLQINTFDGYAIIAVKEAPTKANTEIAPAHNSVGAAESRGE